MMLFELSPFFEFCTLQFCKCDISESIIGRGSKLLSACRVHRGYLNFLLNMAFISPSEVENIYIS